VSESRETQEKIDVGPTSIALLDEIAGRLLSLEKLAKAEVPEGVVEPIEKFTITSQKTFITRPKPWFSLSLINDGDHSVFVIVNVDKSFDEHEVMSGETYNIDTKRGLIKDILIWCRDGETSTIRLVGVR
jgi:hypothetical protein